jgi:hypothetical protein
MVQGVLRHGGRLASALLAQIDVGVDALHPAFGLNRGRMGRRIYVEGDEYWGIVSLTVLQRLCDVYRTGRHNRL